MNEDHIEINFTVDGVVYEAQIWPAHDDEDMDFQVTYFQEDQPHSSHIIFLENKTGSWVQKVNEPDSPAQSNEFIAELGRQIELAY